MTSPGSAPQPADPNQPAPLGCQAPVWATAVSTVLGTSLAAWMIDAEIWLLVFVGAGAATAALFDASRRFRAWATNPQMSPTDLRRLLGASLAGAAGCNVAAAILCVASDRNWRPAAAIGVAVLAWSLMPVMHAIRYEPARPAPTLNDAVKSWGYNAGFAYLSLALPFLIIGAPFIVAAGVPTAWLLSVAVNRMSKHRCWASPGELAFAVAIGACAFATFATDNTQWKPVLAALIVGFGFVDAVSARRRNIATSNLAVWGRHHIVGAGACVVGAGILTVDLARGPLAEAGLRVAILSAIAAFVFGGSFIRRGQGIAVIATVAGLILWVVGDRTDRNPIDPTSGDAPTIVALGDSYTSGEGADAFFAGTSVASENGCRRSSNSYAYRVASRRGRHLVFYACSGALADEIWERGQMPGVPDDDVVGELPQLDNPIPDPFPEFVVISVGGNDALFGDIGRGCALPGSCSDIADIFDGNLEHVGSEVEAALRETATIYRGVPIVVVPYPQMITDRPRAKCTDAPLDDAERAYLHGFINRLDDTARDAAKRVNQAQADQGEEPSIYWFAPGRDAYRGFRICDDPRPNQLAINVLDLQPVDGATLAARLDPTTWNHNSFHPNAQGHELMATALDHWLENDYPNFASPADSFTTDDEVPVELPTTNRCDGRKDCKKAVTAWSITQTIDNARAVLLRLFPIIGLGWLAAAIRRLRVPPREPQQVGEFA